VHKVENEEEILQLAKELAKDNYDDVPVCIEHEDNTKFNIKGVEVRVSKISDRTYVLLTKDERFI